MTQTKSKSTNKFDSFGIILSWLYELKNIFFKCREFLNSSVYRMEVVSFNYSGWECEFFKKLSFV